MTIPAPFENDIPGPIARLRRGVRHQHNWTQLVRFGLVGASGYVVNLSVFAVCVAALSAGHRVAAVVAFAVAVSNNFGWNRRWTFSGSTGRMHHQAVRFFGISVLAFLGALALLELLVGVGLPALPAQAISIVCATPLNFIGNKIWTFTDRRRP